MTIEPSQAYTVCRRPLLPPKPEPRILSPKLSMAEEAKHVRDRFRAKWPSVYGGAAANLAKMEDGRQRQIELVARITELLQQGPMSARQLMDATDTSKGRICAALKQMQDKGTITKGQRTQAGYMWMLA